MNHELILISLHLNSNMFLSTLELNNSVEDYNSLRVGVVCRVSCVPKFKHGIISKCFELEG